MVNFASELRPLGEGPTAAKFNIIGVGAIARAMRGASDYSSQRRVGEIGG